MTQPKRLHRQSSAGRIAGVCAGIATYLDSDVTLIRLAWVVLSVVPGGFIGGLLAYLAAWLIVPDANQPTAVEAAPRRLTRSTADRKLAGVCGGLAEYFHLDATVVRLAWAILTVVPGCIVLGVLAYLVAWFVMPLQSGTEAAAGTSSGVSGLPHTA